MSKLMLLHILVFAIIVMSPAYSQKIGRCLVVMKDDDTVSVLINQRALGGEELALYLGAVNTIDAAFDRGANLPNARELSMILASIRSIPNAVGEDARECLRGQVKDRVTAYCEPGDALLESLLRSKDADLERVAVSILLNQDTREWFNDRDLRRYLQAILDSTEADPDFRISILYLFGYADMFSQVRKAAFGLLSDATDPILARGAAQVIRWEVLRNQGYGALTRLFETSTGLLRQEAAIMLLEESRGQLAPDLRAALESEIIDVLYDGSLPPETRGEAIETCRKLVEEEEVRTALISLLEQKNWFFGVNGTHAKEHSLVAVISVLEPVEHPEVRGALAALQDKLGQLTPRDRPSVVRALQHALR
jgi:hypothetical protein